MQFVGHGPDVPDALLQAHEEGRVVFFCGAGISYPAGTDNQTSVYPKEIAVKALQMRASALVMCHNHPSGDLSPSKADQRLTQIVKDAMAVLDLRCLDHIITGGGRAYSFAENGLI